jgi:uncharacterized protein YkwD
MLAQINAGRTAGGASPAVSTNATLQAVAQAHATYMAAQNAIVQDNAAGKDSLEQIGDAGYTYDDAFVALGSGTSIMQVYGNWNNNVAIISRLNAAAFSDIGIGMATNAAATNRFWVVIVGDPNP